jgi:hypothetical protein
MENINVSWFNRRTMSKNMQAHKKNSLNVTVQAVYVEGTFCLPFFVNFQFEVFKFTGKGKPEKVNDDL